ncbi:ABC transporter permease [Staphylococcus lugdunensis]|uniref:ABC-2 family transporter protein n=1 Tax=Staphylococcus lugdunensis TaxID=28035 RepID=A0ABD4EGH3_STALU|nr:ABC transporter permease [Staphylococcus lugdunensis]KXA38878.1 hypothetical protein HMPREF3225_00983 [Staphylococcus lugdunensis]MCO7040718.1 ABC transporter permease [Staphylococcus lugdunensis]QEX29655.1 ABC transporter permease [Staphylococcus lugdunensis]
MKNLIKSEIYKIKFEKCIWIILILILFVSLNNFGLQTSSNGKEAFCSSTRDFVTLFACAAYAGMSIAYDFSNRTINNLIISGHNRLKVLLSKLVRYYLGCIIIYFSSTIIITLPYLLTKGWGNEFDFDELNYIILYITLTLFFTISTSTIMFFIAFFIKETGLATTLCLFTMLVIILSIKDTQFSSITLTDDILTGNKTFFYGMVWGLIQIIIPLILSFIHFRKVELK